ncbi:hypothetical protein ABIB25_000735 [Nakamurella sp. UYEF19]|uniref:phosphotransferase n=1 Tax=Nakamurella sp. UYEF19 TaxID=1756392 RepID=UPI0033957481
MTDWDVPALLAAAGARLGRELIAVGESLGGSHRSLVLRVGPAGSAGPGTMLIKAFDPLSGADGFAREFAALTVLEGRAEAPRLLACLPEHHLLVISDLGPGGSLADALLGTGPSRAAAQLLKWASAIGALHRDTRDVGAAFHQELQSVGGEVLVDPESPEAALESTADGLVDLLADLGVAFGTPEQDELRRLRPTTDAFALSPSDACPDNNIEVDGRLVLIDFEGATFRHITWDAAYLRVPWPSCWCCWRIEPGAADAALDIWRDAVEPSFPVVRTPWFESDLVTAQIGWSMVSTIWFLTRALDGDPPPENPLMRGKIPPRRSMIQHRLSEVVRLNSPDHPALTDLAGRLLAALHELWGPTPLALAPAFRSVPRG